MPPDLLDGMMTTATNALAEVKRQAAEIIRLRSVNRERGKEITRLRDALYEAFTLIEGRDGHVPDRLRVIAMGTPTVEQGTKEPPK